MESEKLVSQREYARMKGITETSVRKMIKTGRLTEKALDKSNPNRPKIIVAIADKEFVLNTNYNLTRITKSGPNYSRLSTDPEALANMLGAEDFDEDGRIHLPDGVGIDLSKEPRDIAEAKEQEAIYKAIKVRLEVLRMRADLVDKTEVNIQLGMIGVKLRNAFLGVPDQIVADVYAAEDKFQAREIMYKAIETILLNLADLEV